MFKEKLEYFLENNKDNKVKGTTLKLPEVVLEEKRREIIKEWIKSGRIEV